MNLNERKLKTVSHFYQLTQLCSNSNKLETETKKSDILIYKKLYKRTEVVTYTPHRLHMI